MAANANLKGYTIHITTHIRVTKVIAFSVLKSTVGYRPALSTFSLYRLIAVCIKAETHSAMQWKLSLK